MDKSILLNIKKFMQKLNRDPFQKVHAILAENYRRVGLTEDALETASRGLEQFPTYLLCREVLGRIMMRLGQFQEAKEQLEKVHDIVRDNVELNRALAKVYAELHERESARPLLESVLAKDPFDYEMRNLLAGLDHSPAGPESKQEGSPRQEDGVDLFDDTRPKARIFNIEQILADDTGPVASKDARQSATDSMLNGLEDAEDVIESGADRIMSSLTEEDDQPRKKSSTSSRRDLYVGKEKELHGAAVLAQMHMEIQLLDEALNILKKLKELEADKELDDLTNRIEEALEKKETTLDQMEEEELAKGL